MPNIKPTSRAAHKAIQPHKSAQHDKIIKALKRIRNHKGNYQKIAKYAGLYSIAVARRFSDEVALSTSGHPCTVYVLDKKAA